MSPGAGAAAVRALTVVPVILLVLYAMLLGLLGLMCGAVRRKYVTNLSQQALSTASTLMHGPSAWAGLTSGFRQELPVGGYLHEKSAFDLEGLGLSRVLSVPESKALFR
jgi:hypothetical protein